MTTGPHTIIARPADSRPGGADPRGSARQRCEGPAGAAGALAQKNVARETISRGRVVSDIPKVPAEVLERWRIAAGALECSPVQITAYLRFWRRFWRQVVIELQDQGTWRDRDVRLVVEFVDWVRLADFHARQAAQAPYRLHPQSGRVFAHPGWRLEISARREARIVAGLLGLGARFAAGPSGGTDQAGL